MVHWVCMGIKVGTHVLNMGQKRLVVNGSMPLPEVGINWEAIRIYIKIIDLFNYGRQLVCAPPPKKKKNNMMGHDNSETSLGA